MQRQESKPTISHPTNNLGKVILALLEYLLSESSTPLDMSDEISKLNKDVHGNILISLDNRNFALWRDGLKHLFGHGDVFQPLIFPTKRAVIDALLKSAKNGPHADYSGNQSTNIMKKLAGSDNIFAAKDSKTHHTHKSKFIEYLDNTKSNVECAGPIIQKWIEENAGKTITEDTVSILCARLMLGFLLNPEAAKAAHNPDLEKDRDLVKDLLIMKNHFVDVGVNFTEKVFGFFNLAFKKSNHTISEEIARLFNSEEYSYPKILKDSHFTAKAADSHVRSLLMVGFDNLLSCLMSMIYRMAEHPEHNQKLIDQIQELGGVKFIDFHLVKPDAKQEPRTFSQKFFAEALRLNLPVWVQARKAKMKNITVDYTDDDGEKKSFVIPGKTLVLIPNFQLARNIKDGNDFIPEREQSEASFPFPFSRGRNDCPGRNIGYAAAGVLVAELLSTQTLQLQGKPTLDPKVALLLKNLRVKFIPKPGAALKPEQKAQSSKGLAVG